MTDTKTPCLPESGTAMIVPATDEEIDGMREIADNVSVIDRTEDDDAILSLITRIDAERARADGAESERDNLAAELVSSGRVRLHARIAELEAEISRSKQLCAKEYDEQIDPASVSLDWILGGVIAGSRRRIAELEAALAEAEKYEIAVASAHAYFDNAKIGAAEEGLLSRVAYAVSLLAEARKERVCEWAVVQADDPRIFKTGCGVQWSDFSRDAFCQSCGGRVVVKGESNG